MDELHVEAVVDLAAESPHQHFEDVGKGVVVVVPDVRRDGGALDDLPGMPQQKLEEREFLGSQRNRSAAAADGPRADVYFEVVERQFRRRERQRAAARERLQPRDELAEGERRWEEQPS